MAKQPFTKWNFSMIEEIEKVCPEEGQFDAQAIDIDTSTIDNSMQAMTE
jgi:hypothetical protein